MSIRRFAPRAGTLTCVLLSTGIAWAVQRAEAQPFVEVLAVLTGVGSSSAAWGDYDNDGDLDILLAGYIDDEIYVSKVYRNDAGSFVEVLAGLPGVGDGSVAWGDYDNDGDLDILLTGALSSGPKVSKVYRNDAGSFVEVLAGLTGVSSGSVAWGDYDNDGDLDILLTGNSATGVPQRLTRIYRNDAGAFVEVASGLPDVHQASVAWGDYDNDGDLDILLTGNTTSGLVSRIYRNDAGSFVEVLAGLTGVDLGSAAWGDYDNDGDLDILLTGNKVVAVNDPVSKVYRNDAGTFVEFAAGLTGVGASSAAWGDYDNDGDLDILLTGGTGSGSIAKVYRNNTSAPNTPPGPPVNLSSSFADNVLTMSWDAASDDQTPSAGLTYNLRVGTTPGGSELSSVMANAGNGYRRVPGLGNTNHRRTWQITLPPTVSNLVYWSVQAVDAAWAGGPFAPEQAANIFFISVPHGLEPVTGSSVAWGDYDNDGDLDILLTGSASGQIAKVYRNEAGSFFDIDAGLPGVSLGSVAWGDYDNDGDLDILLTGWTGSHAVSKVYRNDAGSFFDIDAGLTGVFQSSAAWGDYDNDGDLDILLTGYMGSAPDSKIYRNDAGSFFDIEAGLPGVQNSSVAWGDYDSDGDLDILLTGGTGSAPVSKVYRNDAGTFEHIAAVLTGVSSSSAAWGDYDNDGDLDILLTGAPSVGPLVSKVYRNDAGSFVDIAALTGVSASSVAWGDYDNDGDLDIMLTGNTGSGRTAKVYRNTKPTPNTPPGPPANLSGSLAGNVLSMSWDAASDDQTPATGLTYNLRIGTTPGGGELSSAMANAGTGYRRVPRLGGTNHRRTWQITLPAPLPSNVCWSVQAVDASWAGGLFAAEQTVVAPPTEIAAGLTGVEHSSVAWGDYDNDGDLDILITGAPGDFQRISRVYRNDPGSFEDIAAGLTGVMHSSVAWGDYDQDGDLDILLTGWTGSEPVSKVYRNEAGTFEDIAAGLTGVSSSSAAWGDYDSDGDLDILLTGWTEGGVSKVYRNDAGSFVDIAAGLTGVFWSSAAWGDYDNDGDLDILLTGWTGSEPVSKVYRNDAGSFEDIEAGLPGAQYSSVAWGDYDSDGDLDILLTGETTGGGVSKIYRNDAGTFFDIAAGLPSVSWSSAAWGDYDNDGDLDILLAGWTGSAPVSKICRNDAGSFAHAAVLTGAQRSSVAWGDYDNDDDLDILLTGNTGSGLTAKVYRNSTTTPNTPPGPPVNLSGSFAGNVLSMSWDAASDDQTPATGLTYNLRIGTTPGGGELSSAMANAGNGYRRVPRLGGTNHRRTWQVTLPAPVPSTVYWSVQAVDAAWAGGLFAPEQSTATVDVPDARPPVAFELTAGAPNPFTRIAHIDFALPRPGTVRLEVYDLSGRRARTLADGAYPAGRHRAEWDGTDGAGHRLPGGVYLYRLQASGFEATRRIVFMR